MLFNSLEFLVLFAVVTPLYFALEQRARWWLLLVVSCGFYMAFVPAYVLILLFTIAVDFVAGLAIERATGRARRVALAASILANVGVLAVFKYGAFAVANWNFLRGRGAIAPAWLTEVVLPIGLSFHTFQAMSYTIEVYRGKQPAERDLLLYALYVMFYPQLVAGPIERPQNLLPQFRALPRFDYERVTDGLKLMLRGFVKKCVVADRLAPLVEMAYRDPRAASGSALALATVFFAFQIYADFSGYSDIALGAAQVMGIRLMQNFRQPYLSQSVSEFWRRWHISLSTWFRDYVFIPLGGSRHGSWLRTRNLMVTFLLSGLWHGASWTYVVWGGLNGLFLVVGDLRKQERASNAWTRAARCGTTFLLICLTWVFFRARTVSDAVVVFTRLASREGLGFSLREVADAGIAISILAVIDVTEALGVSIASLRAKPAWMRWTIYYAATALVLFFGRYGGQQFIYFQF